MSDSNFVKRGIPIVISAPAGTGKGTVISSIMEKSDSFAYSVSATTREPRVGEVDGVNYHFMTREDFERRISDKTMLEYNEYCGNYYGTPGDYAEKLLSAGKNVIFEIEVVGAMNIKAALPDAVLIMIVPPSFKVLEERLRGRGTNTEGDIANRLRRAKEELALIDKYDYAVPNLQGKSAEAAEHIIDIVKSEAYKTARNREMLSDFYN